MEEKEDDFPEHLRLIRDMYTTTMSAIYLKHVKQMSAAFARADHGEAAARKLAIKTCWRATGRASEPGVLNYKTLKWNELHQCAQIESPQIKPSKVTPTVLSTSPSD